MILHHAELVSLTPKAEEQIVYMARVSNPSNQNNQATAPRLLKYLIDHKHWSPFEMASMQVEIRTTRAIAAQILRHRSASFQEFSQRYALSTELGHIPLPDLREQDQKNRQASWDTLPDKHKFDHKMRELFDLSVELYEEMIEYGVAKECARNVLPLATPTRMYMSNTIRGWIHYLEVRGDESTQLEHRLIAHSIRGIFEEQLPNIHAAVWPNLPSYEP